MKRVLLAVVVILAIGGIVSAQDLNVNSWDSWFKAGDTSVSLGVGLGSGYSYLAVGAYPGFEQTVFDTKVGDVWPVSIGVAVKGMVNLYVGGYSGIALGAGAFVPFHFGLKNLGLPIFEQMDFYVAPGVAITFDLGDLNPNLIGFGDYAGFNYFLSDSMAVYVEQVYWGSYVGGTVGVVLKR